MSATDKRERLVESASILFHQKGMNATSLADIAAHAKIPIGNVYYYFKTKEDLALAALDKRKQEFASAYLELDENISDPRMRLVEALNYFDKQREDYAKYGCPIGRFIEEASAEQDTVSKAAVKIFEEFVGWSEQQFKLLGHSEDAKRYAISMLSGVEGATIMAKAFGDTDIISHEIARLTKWLELLPNKKISLGKVGLKMAANG